MLEEIYHDKVLIGASNSPNVPDIEVVSELVGSGDISHLEGKLKTYIDSLGLSDKQEKAMKDIVQQIIWEWFYFIRDHFTDYLLDKRNWYFANRPEGHNKRGSAENN